MLIAECLHVLCKSYSLMIGVKHAYDESSAPASSLDRRDLTVELVNTSFLEDLQSHSMFSSGLWPGEEQSISICSGKCFLKL